MSDEHWRREDAGTLILTLHVQPGAARTEVAGMHGDALKIRLAAPPVEGRANDALRRYLADAFGVAWRDVIIERGETSRRKIVRIVSPRRRPDLDWS
ncbi:MAG: YggU family protein [Burkholderiales bacterium]|nr:YggU family protein [Burkholderiales bacterium]